MPKKQTKKKTEDKRTYKRVWENGRWVKKPLQYKISESQKKPKFCKNCGFEKIWACPEHGCGSEERVGEKKSENTKRWKW